MKTTATRQDALDAYYKVMELALGDIVDSKHSLKLQEVATFIREEFKLTEEDIDTGTV